MKDYLDQEVDIFEQQKVPYEEDGFQYEVVTMLDSGKMMKEETIADVHRILKRNLQWGKTVRKDTFGEKNWL